MIRLNRRINHEIAMEKIAREAIFSIGPDNKLSYANAAFLRRFGYSSIEEYNSVEDRTIFADIVDETKVRTRLERNETVIDIRIVCKTYKQGTFWGLVSFVPTARQSFVGAVIDITTLVENEFFLKKRTTALTKSKIELDRFIYSASHDIRAPISTVMGLINLINVEPNRERVTDLVGMIGSTMNKLDVFLHQLDTHSNNSYSDLNLLPIELQPIIAKALNHWRDHPAYHSMSISINARSIDGFTSDPERLTSILIHLVKNCLDYADVSKPEKKLDIQASIVRERLVLEVFDNGVGIPADKIANVFDMFYRASMLSKGSGLGLFLVREILSNLNGVATIYSRVGVGTLVRLDIPNAGDYQSLSINTESSFSD